MSRGVRTLQHGASFAVHAPCGVEKTLACVQTEASSSSALKLSDFTRASAPTSASASPAIVPATPPRAPSVAGLSSAGGGVFGAGGSAAASKPTPLVLERQASSQQSSLAPSLTLASAGMQAMKPGEGGAITCTWGCVCMLLLGVVL